MITPLNNNVILKKVVIEEVALKNQLLIVPNTASSPTYIAEVVSSSNDLLVTGDKVLVRTLDGLKFTLNGEEVVILDFSKVLGKL